MPHCHCGDHGFESRKYRKCNDSETNGGTDAKYEMETFETRIKV